MNRTILRRAGLALLSCTAFGSAYLFAQTPLYISPTGRVGINLPNDKKPEAWLHVYGSFRSDSLTADGAAWFKNKVTVDGSVGIGTPATANTALSVKGSASFQGPLVIGDQTRPDLNFSVSGPVAFSSPIFLNGPQDRPYFISVGKMGSNQTEMVGYDGVRLGYMTPNGTTPPETFTTMINMRPQGVGIGSRAGAQPRCLLDVLDYRDNRLSAVFARFQDGDDVGDGTYLGVRAYSTQPQNTKCFALEHRYHNYQNGAINFYRGLVANDGKITISFQDRDYWTFTEKGSLTYGTSESFAPINVEGYFTGGKGDWTAEQRKISIRGSNWIMGAGFHNMSDARHKKNISGSDPARDLTLLRRLRVADYQYIDSFSKGRGWQKGFIAQEVETVLPQVVQKLPEAIPDIYAIPASFVQNGETLALTMQKPHGLKTGDRVRMIAGGVTQMHAVEVRNDRSFTVSGWQGKTVDLFVFGREVPDFRTVDYQQLTALSIGALQSLAGQVDDLKKENEALRREAGQLRDELERRIRALEQKAAVSR